MKSLRNEVILYGFVGALGTLVDIVIFFTLSHFSVPILIAQWISAIIGATHNHLWHHFKVFTHDQSFKKSYSLVLSISIISIFISGPFLVFIQSIIGVLWVSKVSVILVLGILNYLLRKLLVFRKKS